MNLNFDIVIIINFKDKKNIQSDSKIKIFTKRIRQYHIGRKHKRNLR